MVERLVLVRHGQTEWSETRRHTGRSEVPLTDLGRAQAGELKAMLSHFNFSKVFSSPLSRAQDTAQLAGYSFELLDDLMEWDYGIYEGERTVETRKEIPNWSVWTHEIVGGESLRQLGTRADRVIERVAEEDGDVALFGHGHALRVLTARWLGLPPKSGSRFVFDTAAVSVLGYERETRAVIHWNDVNLNAGTGEIRAPQQQGG